MFLFWRAFSSPLFRAAVPAYLEGGASTVRRGTRQVSGIDVTATSAALIDYTYYYSSLRRDFAAVTDIYAYGPACMLRNPHSDKTHLLLFSDCDLKFEFLTIMADAMVRLFAQCVQDLLSGAFCAGRPNGRTPTWRWSTRRRSPSTCAPTCECKSRVRDPSTVVYCC